MTCPTTARAWYKDNTMVVQLGTLITLGDDTDAPLTDALTDTVITDATVAAQVEDLTGAAVGGAISMAHVSGGVYRGTGPAALAVEVGVDYVVEIVATKAGNTGTWRVPITVEERTA
jgi:hypothetical protein